MRSLVCLLALAFCFVALPAHASSPCCDLGDVNGSSSVTTLDLIKITQYCSNSISLTAEQVFNGDVNGDGSLCATDGSGNNLDIEIIQDYILGIIETFPKCGDLDEDGLFEYGDSSLGEPTDDADILRDHILAVQTITDPVVFSNADANVSGTLSTLDIVLFRKVYLGTEDGTPSCEY